MTNKENVFLKLKELSNSIVDKDVHGITAQDIANIIGIRRNIASQLLNELSREGKAVKINTRPVYFIDREIYEKRKQDNKSLTNYNKPQEEEVFRNLIGYDGSLKYVVEQCKAAISYPPNGLPFLLVGSSGVGKSFLAQLAFEFAKSKEIINKDAEFMVLNCAEYANNPELLSSVLFGYTKGAYTGADSNKVGLIEEADGGVLFLDEIHRLPPEGQEKLFLFLDKGIFRRLGESNKWRSAKVKMIFATTENPENSFLQTFLRRIPLIVKIPTFQERPFKEKINIIYNFYKKEAIVIKKDIIISNQVMNILLKSKASGNLGKLTNAIKLSCADALNKIENKEENSLKIKVSNLEKIILNEYDGVITNNLNINDIFLSCSEIDEIQYISDGGVKIGGSKNDVVKSFIELKNKKIDNNEFLITGLGILNKLIDSIVFGEIDIKQSSVIFLSVKRIIENTISNLKSDYGLRYYSNSVDSLTYLLSYFVEYGETENDEEVEKIVQHIHKFYPREYKIVLNLFDNVNANFDIKLNRILIIYLLIYIKSLNKNTKPDQINAIIIAHGYNTASSIAGVTNRLLGGYIFDSLNMPLEITPKEIAKELSAYIENIDTARGLIILVDMGSLENIYKEIDKDVYGDIGIINNISTHLALDVGSRIINSQSIEQILKETVEKNICKYNYIPSKKAREDAIITTCVTGIGTANKIKDMLDKCFLENEIKVIAYDYNKLKGNGEEDYIFKKYNVKLIIGTSDPKAKSAPYISLEDLIMKRGDYILNKALENVVDNSVIEKINREIVKFFTLDNVLNYITILNPDKIIDQVDKAIYNLELALALKFNNDLRISLSIHICCLIERLIIKDPITTYNKLEDFQKCHIHFIELTKKAFSVIEQFYNVDIPMSEIGFIYDSITNKIEDFKF